MIIQSRYQVIFFYGAVKPWMNPGYRLLFKHHWWWELTKRIERNGNPRWYGCYKDESLNGMISKIAKSTHKKTFAISVLKKYRIVRLCMGRHYWWMTYDQCTLLLNGKKVEYIYIYIDNSLYIYIYIYTHIYIYKLI